MKESKEASLIAEYDSLLGIVKGNWGVASKRGYKLEEINAF